MAWWDRDIELIFIQFKDVPAAYSVELGSKDETVNDIKEKLKKEYPNGRHLKPQETLVYKNQELKGGDLITEYHLPKNTLLHVAERNAVAAPTSPKNVKEKEEEGPWDLGVVQSVKQGQLQPVDLLTMDEPFYNNPFLKPKEMNVNRSSGTPAPNLNGSRRKMVVEDETTKVCDKIARMSPLPKRQLS
uniref:uncharacterized protein LOC105351987 n=1 Tax=Fragaria vesca subsp. vesca TaxID=101020 RepID=UPI0005C8F9D3|nr:PREDICTED: uncharacterized protein LOC105351987 [Fragaria vesca subsp. vesca]XP_011466011.1 PREDICTED: uncharacterized protein LOC105351987 [Fragaria vesca subsp. vesca]